jgi:hypothetical protein
LRLTGSDRAASVSSSFIIRSITWMAVFSRVVGGMVQGNIQIVGLIPPYETPAKTVVARGFALIKQVRQLSRSPAAAQRECRSMG